MKQDDYAVWVNGRICELVEIKKKGDNAVIISLS